MATLKVKAFIFLILIVLQLYYIKLLVMAVFQCTLSLYRIKISISFRLLLNPVTWISKSLQSAFKCVHIYPIFVHWHSICAIAPNVFTYKRCILLLYTQFPQNIYPQG